VNITITAQPHELMADFQECIGAAQQAVSILAQLGSSSEAFDTSLWLVNHAYKTAQVLESALDEAGISSDLMEICKGCERAAISLTASCTANDLDEENLVSMVGELLEDVSEKAKPLFGRLYHQFGQGELS